MQSPASAEQRRPCQRQTLLVTQHCPMEMRSRGSWSIDQFVVAKKLGGGYASTVHLAVCKATGIQVAVKVYHRCKLSQLNHYQLSQLNPYQVKREIRIHSELDHPNVLRLYAAFEDEVGVYLVTEYASRGDVFGELDRRGGTMSEGEAVRQVLRPFMAALRYLHGLNIIHRDIKPENLLMDAAGELKVADFGLSIDITCERPVTRVGTLDYMAPEVVVCPDKCQPGDGRGRAALHYTHLVDAWAVGVLAFELTVGRAPFDAGSKRATIDQILGGAPAFPAWLGEQARHFIQWSLTKDAASRPDVPQLAYHPWVTSHAAPPRPRTLGGSARAMSMANLQALPGGASDNHTHMEARHKALVSGHVGVGGSGGLGSSDSFDEDEGGGAASAAAAHAVAAAAARAAGAPSPFAGHAAPEPEPHGGGGSALTSSGSGSVLETAPASLRAYVHRCQSANNLESLRAAVLAQPPEPSNACFEPGGRYYSPGGAPGRQRAPPAPPAPPAPSGSGQQQQQQQPWAAAAHDAAPSAAAPAGGGGGSPKPSAGSAPPPLPPAAPPRPAPLQLVRLLGGAEPAAAGGAASPPPAPAKQQPHLFYPQHATGAGLTPPSPAARCLSPAAGGPITPEPSAPPRPQPFAKGGAAAAARGSRSGSQDSSRGSTAADLGYGNTSGGSATCSDGGGSCGSGSGGCGSDWAGAPPALAAPTPVSVSPTGGPAGARPAAGAGGAGAAPAAPRALRGVLTPEPAAGAAGGDGGGAAAPSQGSWFSLQCLNLMKPSKA
ncbi:MAG: kinase-like domain-containing protein [Monoraphidium minutum]|nr:MAG: kinase-like domain-containing protein [Monoraphidium minutum]